MSVLQREGSALEGLTLAMRYSNSEVIHGTAYNSFTRSSQMVPPNYKEASICSLHMYRERSGRVWQIALMTIH